MALLFFLPVLWRIALAVVGKRSLATVADWMLAIGLPFLLILVLAWAGWESRGHEVEGLILVILFFWAPQVIGVALLGLCDIEQSRREKLEAASGISSGEGQEPPPSRREKNPQRQRDRE